jgi:HAD superfamily hydrolase (TIGR01509 family)
MKQEYTMEMVYSNCKPVFAHEYALARLKAEGYKLAVASNSVRDTIDLMMKKSNLNQYLEFTLSNQDVVNAKPDPEIYTTAVNKLGYKPDECLVLEDNQNGIKSAEAAGTHVFKVDTVNDVTYSAIMKKITECNRR